MLTLTNHLTYKFELDSAVVSNLPQEPLHNFCFGKTGKQMVLNRTSFLHGVRRYVLRDTLWYPIKPPECKIYLCPAQALCFWLWMCPYMKVFVKQWPLHLSRGKLFWVALFFFKGLTFSGLSCVLVGSQWKIDHLVVLLTLLVLQGTR